MNLFLTRMEQRSVWKIWNNSITITIEISSRHSFRSTGNPLGMKKVFDLSSFVDLTEKSLFLEKTRRLSIFKENLNRIEQLNVNEQGTAIYGITHLADLSEEEFTEVFLNPRLADATKKESLAVNPMDVSPPAFDWRNLSAVTDVKNQVERNCVSNCVSMISSQGQCGSCWAFSVTGNIEGVWKVKTDQLVSLSEQGELSFLFLWESKTSFD